MPLCKLPLVNASPVQDKLLFMFTIAGTALVLFKVKVVREVTEDGIFKGPTSVPPKLRAPVTVRLPVPEIAGPFKIRELAAIARLPLVKASVPDMVNPAPALTVAGEALVLFMVRLFKAVTELGILKGPEFDPVKIRFEDDVVTKVPDPTEMGFPAIVSVLLPVSFNAPEVSVNVPLIDKALFTKTPAALFIVRLFNTLD